MENKTVRWGLLGAGKILDRWMNGARRAPGTEIVAVASRTVETAQTMAKKHGIPCACTYDELLERQDIDVVYIAVPHQAHRELALRAMRAGMSVLVEKPATVNAGEFRELCAVAKEQGVFLMEAVWTRCFPLMEKLRAVIAEGKIGDVRFLRSAFAFRVGNDYVGRLFDPMAAGGGLLDVGVYNLHFANALLGMAPVSVVGAASIGNDELHLAVDEQASYIASYPGGILAEMFCAVRTTVPAVMEIYGTKGSITVGDFFRPTVARVNVDGQTETITCPVPQNGEWERDEGYQYEVIHVNECLQNGMKESPIVTWEDTLAVLRACDTLRQSWGLRYPFEAQG